MNEETKSLLAKADQLIEQKSADAAQISRKAADAKQLAIAECIAVSNLLRIRPKDEDANQYAVVASLVERTAAALWQTAVDDGLDLPLTDGSFKRVRFKNTGAMCETFMAHLGYLLACNTAKAVYREMHEEQRRVIG